MKTKVFFILCLLVLAAGCSARLPEANAVHTDTATAILVTDSLQQTVKLEATPQTVLALSSSIAEIWLLAGGTLMGVTSDAIGERELGLPEDLAILGTIREPSMEGILGLNPDFVLLSPDIDSHNHIAEALRQTGVPTYMAKVETLEDYIKVLEDFTNITGDTEKFERNGKHIAAEVESLLSQLAKEKADQPITALFLRAYSSGVRAKASEHTVCTILDDLGIINIAAVTEGFPLDDLSFEAIVAADPDYILIVPMGDEEAAHASLEASLLSNPAFANLKAVQKDRVILLPKDLFHYKPNNRWGEAYGKLLNIFYPEIFPEN